MKLYVTHDQEGNIVAIDMPNPDAGQQVSIATETGYSVSEVDLVDDQADFVDEEKAIRKLTEIVEHYRIEVPTRRGKLVSRKPLST
jgi:hypothetical protein